MRFIVCGGRDYNDKEFLYSALNKLHKSVGIDCVIQGGAPGADFLAKCWAKDNSVEMQEFKAEWHIFGREAGPKRNTRMLMEGQPDGVVAFPRANGDMGPGTANMARKAQEAGLKVWFPADNVGG